MSKPVFKKKIIGELNNNVPPSQMNLFTEAADINKNGLIDLVMSGVNGKLVWFENKNNGTDFIKHKIDDVTARSMGTLYDLTGNGYPDIIIGGDYRSNEIYWWENPGDTNKKWQKRLLYSTPFNKHHDIIIGDIKKNGEKGLIISNQYSKDNAGTTYYYIPLPEDPYVSPWPDDEVIATGKYENNPKTTRNANKKQPEEGLAIADIDGDGKNELIAGTWWFKYTNETGWREYKFAKGYLTTKIAVADIDGDGKNEIVLSEGDPCIFGRPEGGKLAWFKPKGDITDYWTEHRIDAFLLDAHSLQVGDICGNGKPDILVGECGTAYGKDKGVYTGRLPSIYVYENDGTGNFIKHPIDKGTGSHDALLLDLRNKGVLDIYSKPIFGPERWNIHIFYNKTENNVK